MTGLVPVIEIGGTHLDVAHVDVTDGHVVATTRRRRALDSAGSAEQIVESLVTGGNALAAEPGGWWGIAVPGPFDYEHGIGDFDRIGKFESLHGFDLSHALRRQLDPTPGGLAFVNDADAFLLGEWVAGAARGHRRAAAITLGTGVGSSFLVDGVLVHDGPGIPENGQVWTLSHDGAPLEDTVSRRAIRTQYAADVGSSEEPDVMDIAARARDGDAAAGNAFERTFRILGAVLAPCLREFGASALVLGGSIAQSWDLIAPPLHDGLRTASPDLSRALRIEPAANREDAALLGAATHAAQQQITWSSRASHRGR